MKKYLCMAAAGMLLFSACSNEDDVINNGNSSADFEGQELVMKVVSTGDGLTTRAGRPLYSSEAGQKIDEVKLAIFKLNKQNAIESCVFEKTIKKWQEVGKDYGNTIDGSVDHGKYFSLNLKKELDATNGLDEGDYMVYAVGYSADENDPSVYTYNPSLESIIKDWDDAANFTSIKATTGEDAEEIFAGSIAKITVNKDRNFDVVANKPDNNILYLHRQVAGAFGYFKNIPAAGPDGTPATHLRLVAADKNKTVNMTNFNTGFRTTNDNNVKYVVNGESPATADAKFVNGNDGFEVYSITLKEWFKQGDQNKNGIFDAEDEGYGIPSYMTNFNALKGSVFAGKFVVPFANKGETAKTFELQLVNRDRNAVKILRTWTINLASAQQDVEKADGTKVENESTSSYSIVRNHLYTIGKKDIANPTDPTEPTDPENPEDLSKGQILTLRVNDNWETIEKLEVEPEI